MDVLGLRNKKMTEIDKLNITTKKREHIITQGEKQLKA